MNLKFSLEYIYRKMTFTILTIIQLTIIIILTYSVISIINKSNNSLNKIKELYNNKDYFILDTSQIDINKLDMNKLDNIKNFLDKNPNINFFSAHPTASILKESEVLPQTILNYDPIVYENQNYSRVKTYQVSNKFLKDMNFDFIKGNMNNFIIKDNLIPVILGSDYLNKYSIGDLIPHIYFNGTMKPLKGTMKVVGILKKDNYISRKGNPLSVTSLNNCMLIPYNFGIKLVKHIETYNYISDGYIIFKKNINIDKFSNKLKSFGYDISIKSLNSSINEYKDITLKRIQPLLITSILILLFTSISIIVVLRNSILKNLRNYGIHLILGATRADIKKQILGEIYLLYLISFINSIIFIFKIFKSNIDLSFNLINLIESNAIIILIIILLSKIILLKLNKYSLNDLVRRNE